jgi:hypothetical protein
MSLFSWLPWRKQEDEQAIAWSAPGVKVNSAGRDIQSLIRYMDNGGEVNVSEIVASIRFMEEELVEDILRCLTSEQGILFQRIRRIRRSQLPSRMVGTTWANYATALGMDRNSFIDTYNGTTGVIEDCARRRYGLVRN